MRFNNEEDLDDKYGRVFTRTPREDYEATLLTVEYYVQESVNKYKTYLEGLVKYSEDFQPLEGRWSSLYLPVREMTREATRANVASHVGHIIKDATQDGLSRKDCLKRIARQAEKSIGGQITLSKRKTIDRDPITQREYAGYNEFADYDYVVELDEWRHYLEMTTEGPLSDEEFNKLIGEPRVSSD